VPRDLTDSVIVITGASSGIGAATALACAGAGMDVVLNARRADRLEAIAERVGDLGRRAVIVDGCVTEADMSERLLDTAIAEFGRVDAVFANAGYGLNKPFVDETDDDLRRIFEVNFFAAVDLLRAGARRLLDTGGGHLLMCSSCLSKFALPDHGAYSATKSAQAAVCSAMRLELAGHGIEVSSVHPITTTTELFDVSARTSGLEPPANGVPEHAPGFLVQPPERVARAIVACLRRPRREVWTSLLVRTVAGAMTIFPPLYDWSMRRQMKAEMKALREKGHAPPRQA
jgi:short-subunit dehydrogenase